MCLHMIVCMYLHVRVVVCVLMYVCICACVCVCGGGVNFLDAKCVLVMHACTQTVTLFMHD